MILVILLIGIILIVTAVRNTQGDLFSALATDIPAFTVWAAAIIALGAIGYIPGLKPISRGLLFLVITVLIVNNYKNIGAGFSNAWKNPPASGATQQTDNSDPANALGTFGTKVISGGMFGGFLPKIGG